MRILGFNFLRKEKNLGTDTDLVYRKGFESIKKPSVKSEKGSSISQVSFQNWGRSPGHPLLSSHRDRDTAEVKRCRETACPAWALQLGRGPRRGRQDQGGCSALIAPPLKGLQGLWGQRPGLTCHVAERGCLRTETWTLPKCSLQPQCFLSVLGLFFKNLFCLYYY